MKKLIKQLLLFLIILGCGSVLLANINASEDTTTQTINNPVQVIDESVAESYIPVITTHFGIDDDYITWTCNEKVNYFKIIWERNTTEESDLTAKNTNPDYYNGENYYFFSCDPGDYDVHVVSCADEDGTIPLAYSSRIDYLVSGTLTSPLITLNGTTLSWSSVNTDLDINENIYYDVFLENNLIGTVNGNRVNQSALNTYTINSNGNYKVKARTSATYYNESLFSNVVYYQAVVQLSAPTLAEVDQVVNWSSIPNANSYDVYVNSNNAFNQTTTNYDLSSSSFGPGSYSVKVKAKSTNIYFSQSNFSNVVTITKYGTLSAPTLSINGTTLSWNAVPNAGNYSIYLSDTLIATQSSLTYDLSSLSVGGYTIKVKCNANGYYLESPLTTKLYSVTGTLSAPTLSISGTTLSWNAVPNSYNYSIYIDNTFITTQSTRSYDLSSLSIGAHSIKVKCDDHSYYLESGFGTINYTKYGTLTAPTISITEDTLTWSAIPNASNYAIYANDTLIATQTTTSYDLSSLDDGTYSIKVKCNATGYYQESSFSTSLSHTVTSVTYYYLTIEVGITNQDDSQQVHFYYVDENNTLVNCDSGFSRKAFTTSTLRIKVVNYGCGPNNKQQFSLTYYDDADFELFDFGNFSWDDSMYYYDLDLTQHSYIYLYGYADYD